MSVLDRIAPLVLASLFLGALPALSAEPPAPAAAAQGKPAPAVVEAPKAPTDVLARVNGSPITRGDLDRALKVMLAQNKVTQPLPPEVMKRAEEAALDQLAAAELLYQEAQKLEVGDLEKQVKERIAKNRERFKTDQEFAKALQEVNMTVQDMQLYTRKDILIGNFVEKQFADKAGVTDDDARKFYDENLERYFKKEASVRASHILIGVDPKASTEEKAKAKEKAEAVLKRVKAGEDFAALAKSNSSCPSASQGGDLGKFGKGQMVAAFEKAAFDLKPGEVSDVVETKFGYHVIKLTEKQEASQEKFENVKPRIKEHLKREKVQKELTSFVEELKKKAKIEKL